MTSGLALSSIDIRCAPAQLQIKTNVLKGVEMEIRNIECQGTWEGECELVDDRERFPVSIVRGIALCTGCLKIEQDYDEFMAR